MLEFNCKYHIKEIADSKFIEYVKVTYGQNTTMQMCTLPAITLTHLLHGKTQIRKIKEHINTVAAMSKLAAQGFEAQFDNKTNWKQLPALL